MPVAYVQEWPIVDRSTDNYDFIADKIGTGPFDGLILHSAGFDGADGVFRIFDIWESKSRHSSSSSELAAFDGAGSRSVSNPARSLDLAGRVLQKPQRDQRSVRRRNPLVAAAYRSRGRRERSGMRLHSVVRGVSALCRRPHRLLPTRPRGELQAGTRGHSAAPARVEVAQSESHERVRTSLFHRPRETCPWFAWLSQSLPTTRIVPSGKGGRRLHVDFLPNGGITIVVILHRRIRLVAPT